MQLTASSAVHAHTPGWPCTVIAGETVKMGSQCMTALEHVKWRLLLPQRVQKS